MLNNAYTEKQRKHMIPDGYFSYLSEEEKISLTYTMAQLVEEKFNVNIVGGSITGSRLRGVDNPQSDSDFLFLTDLPLKKAKSKVVNNHDIQLESIWRYSNKLYMSIPYMEFRKSPFLIIDDKYKAFLLSHKSSIARLNAHGKRFITHLINRQSLMPNKKLLNIICTYNLITYGEILVNRNLMNTSSQLAREAREFLIENNLYSVEIDELYVEHVVLA